MIHFPEDLPITARVRDIALAVDAHPVVVVAGETGSGKTTQLPKICLAMGRGLKAAIAVTQPRRIAATSVAARVASELKVELGHEVGYQIRFAKKAGPGTYVKFMTDGILLAELQGDPLLHGYDTIIVDEAHERSLNIADLVERLAEHHAAGATMAGIASSTVRANTEGAGDAGESCSLAGARVSIRAGPRGSRRLPACVSSTRMT